MMATAPCSSHHVGLVFDKLGLNVLFSVTCKQDEAAALQICVQCFIVQHHKITTLKTSNLSKQGYIF